MGLFKKIGKATSDESIGRAAGTVASGTKDVGGKVVSGTKKAGETTGRAIVNTGKQGAVQGGKAVNYVGRKNGMSGDVSAFMLKKHGAKESLAKMGKKVGAGIFDPATPISGYLYKMGLVGPKDKKDVKLGIDIVYGAGTAGFATGGDALVDVNRRRAGKGKRAEKKQQTKERHAARDERERQEDKKELDRIVTNKKNKMNIYK